MPLVDILFKKLIPSARIPSYESDGAAGFDLYAPEGAPDIIVAPGHKLEVPLGFATEIPAGYFVDVRPRSGHARKGRITLQNSPGTVDSDYRGEWILLVINEGGEPYKISNNKAVAQGVLLPVTKAIFRSKEELSETVRGTGGFGSTDENK